MNPTPGGAASAPSASRSFVLAAFVLGAILTAVVGYWGISGGLDGGVPGNQHLPLSSPTPPRDCQGHGALGHFHFTLIAGVKGTETFNGSSPGPCFAVAVGSVVNLTFYVNLGAFHQDSWVLIPGTGPTDQLPVFAGAGPSDTSRLDGLHPGQNQSYTFTASAAGAYRYVSEVDDHAAVGMWGAFNVTSSPLEAGPALGAPTNPVATGGPAARSDLILRYG